MRCVSRVIGLIAVVFAAGVVVARPASAALCAKWDPPETTAAGTSAIVSFRTHVPISTNGDDYTLEPHAFPDYPFRVQAISPNGTAVDVSMATTGNDVLRWSGEFTADQGGSWTLIILNLQDADAPCYADMLLLVTEEATSRTLEYALVGLVALAAIGGFAVLRRRRVRLRP